VLPDDKRHGTTAGHNAGCRCEPCCAAKLAYDKRRRLDAANGKPRKVPAYRVTRRVEALQALGWSLRRIAAEAGVTYNHLAEYGYDRDAVYADHFEKIDAAYRRLCMTLPPEDTPGQRSGAQRTRSHARRNGFLPPLVWDDIDDPAEQPTDWQYRPADRTEQLRDLAEQGVGISEECRRLKVGRDALEKFCQRHEIGDVYHVLAGREQRRANQHADEVA
jgi:hypothetical protein